jgi:spore germination cell wall hydrolase CwlJ-like protein
MHRPLHMRNARQQLLALCGAGSAAMLMLAAMVALVLNPDLLSDWSAKPRSVPATATSASPSQGVPVPASVEAEFSPEAFLPGRKLNLTPEQAEKRNLASPLATTNPSAPMFNPGWLAPADLSTATDCMAKAIYYEAGHEPPVGQMAVAQVILNLLRHPRYPKSVCGVVFQGSERPTGCQFTFTCDGAMQRKPDAASFARARGVADAALHGAVSFIAGQATHYHTVSIVPVWAGQLSKVAIIGHHVFYRPPQAYGGWPAQISTPLTQSGATQQLAPPQVAALVLPAKPGFSLVPAAPSYAQPQGASAKAEARPSFSLDPLAEAAGQAEAGAVRSAPPAAARAQEAAASARLFGEERRHRPNIALPAGGY